MKSIFVGQTIIKIDENSIYLSNGAVIDFHAYETYFNGKNGEVIPLNKVLQENNK